MSLKLNAARWVWRQSWLSLRHKKSAYRILGQNGELPDAPFVTDFFGLRYEGNLQDGIEFALFYYGAFEKPLLFFMRNAMRAISGRNSMAPGSPVETSGTCFCDIGSNVGQHALFMSNHADQIHAFEPFDEVRSRLAHNIQLNSLKNIKVHSVGLGETAGEFDFYAPTGGNRGIGSFVATTRDKGNVPIGKLKVVKGDEYFLASAISNVQMIKIDVEGFEKGVLRGLSRTLKKCRPIVVCEVTYGVAESFASLQELQTTLPDDYAIYQFNVRKADGSTARRRGSRAKRSGAYELIPARQFPATGQGDMVAIPREILESVPLTSTEAGKSGKKMA